MALSLWLFLLSKLMVHRLIEYLVHALLNIDIFLCRYIKILHIVFLSHRWSLIGWDFSFCIQVYLITYHYFWNISIRMVIYGLHPIFNVIECFVICDIKCNYYSISLFIKGICKSFKSLLSCCIPDLNLNVLAILRLKISCNKI